MSLEGVTSTVMEALQNTLTAQISSIVPDLFKQLSPMFIDLVRKEIAQYLSKDLDIKEIVKKTVKETLVSVDDEVAKFRNSKFAAILDDKLERRDQEYYKYARDNDLLRLYGECMALEPLYVPKKFRNDKYHVMSERELTIINKLELKRLQTECEILTGRRDEFQKRCNAFDAEVNEIISMCDLSDKAAQICLKRWTDLVAGDIKRVDQKMAKKYEGMKNSFMRDREYLQYERYLRVKKVNSSIKSTSAQRDISVSTCTTSSNLISLQDFPSISTTRESPRQLSANSSGFTMDLDEITPRRSIQSPSARQLPVLSLNPTSNMSDDQSQQAVQSPNIRLSGIGTIPKTNKNASNSSKNSQATLNNHPPITETKGAKARFLRSSTSLNES